MKLSWFLQRLVLTAVLLTDFLGRQTDALKCYSCIYCHKSSAIYNATDPPLTTCAANYVCLKLDIYFPDNGVHQTCVSSCTAQANNGYYEVNCCSDKDGCNEASSLVSYCFLSIIPFLLTIVGLMR